MTSSLCPPLISSSALVHWLYTKPLYNWQVLTEWSEKGKCFWLLSLIPVAASQHILQIPFFTLKKKFYSFWKTKSLLKMTFCVMEKRKGIYLPADLVETQKLSQEWDLILWSRGNYSSSSHLRQEHREVSKISSIWCSQLPTQISWSLPAAPNKERFPRGLSHRTWSLLPFTRNPFSLQAQQRRCHKSH